MTRSAGSPVDRAGCHPVFQLEIVVRRRTYRPASQPPESLCRLQNGCEGNVPRVANVWRNVLETLGGVHGIVVLLRTVLTLKRAEPAPQLQNFWPPVSSWKL